MPTLLNDKSLSNEISQNDLVRSHNYPEFESYPVEEIFQSSYDNKSYEDEFEEELIE